MFADKRKKKQQQQDVALVLPLASVNPRPEAEVAFMFCLKKRHKSSKAVSTYDRFPPPALQIHCYCCIQEKRLDSSEFVFRGKT